MLFMSWKFVPVVSIVGLVAAAIGGCANVRSAASSSEGDRGVDVHDARQLTAGAAGTAPQRSDGEPAAEACPRVYPTVGTACRVPEQETCTFRGDGACSPTNPDRIAVCSGGRWASVAPAIACPPLDGGAADGGATDCSRPLTLSDYCNQHGRTCSLSFAEMRKSYCDPMYRHITTTMQANRCDGRGGRSLFTRLGNSRMRFDYDGTGTLRSVQSKDDVPFGACMRHEYVYGEPCELVDLVKPACSPLSDEDAG